MFSMQDKENFQGFDKFGVRFEVALIQMVEHVKEVFNVAEILGWHVVLSTDSVSVGISSYSWNQTQKPIDLFVSGENVFVDLFPS